MIVYMAHTRKNYYIVKQIQGHTLICWLSLYRYFAKYRFGLDTKLVASRPS